MANILKKLKRFYMEKKNSHYFYVLECCDGSYYAGYTTDVKRRVEQHNKGKGAKYTRSRIPVQLIYSCEYETKTEAMQEEYAFKQLTRIKKERYIKKGGQNDASTKEL